MRIRPIPSAFSGYDIAVSGHCGKNYVMTMKGLRDEIVPESSQIKVSGICSFKSYSGVQNGFSDWFSAENRYAHGNDEEENRRTEVGTTDENRIRREAEEVREHSVAALSITTWDE